MQYSDNICIYKVHNVTNITETMACAHCDPFADNVICK